MQRPPLNANDRSEPQGTEYTGGDASGRETRGALFLDRDGVVNDDLGYIGSVDRFRFAEGIFAVLETARASGLPVIVITNQSGIGRGYYSEADYELVTRHMCEICAARGVPLADVLHCPHAPDEDCACRKPSPLLIRQAAARHRIDLTASWMVGDKPSDVEAGIQAGIAKTVILGSRKCAAATYRIDDLSQLTELLQTHA